MIEAVEDTGRRADDVKASETCATVEGERLGGARRGTGGSMREGGAGAEAAACKTSGRGRGGVGKGGHWERGTGTGTVEVTGMGVETG